MAKIIELPTFSDPRGDLTVIEKVLPFDVKRIFFIYNVNSKRGEHGHKKTKQAFISLGGECRIYIKNNHEEKYFTLKDPKDCLIVEPEDWHFMDHFSEKTTLLVLASEYYNKKDYIFEKP